MMQLMSLLAVLPLVWTTATIAAQTGYTNDLGMTFLPIPAGSFLMGTEDLDEVAFELPDGNLEQVRDETPAHRVGFPQGFLLGKTEVTQGQWFAVMGTRPGPEAHWDRLDWREIPVVSVTWYDAQSFAQRLSQQDPDADYRLPGEAEWEYAARADTRGLRPMPLAELPAQAWYLYNSGDEIQPVATRAANPWGIHDLLGNVWEWTNDWYAADTYARGETTTPEGPPEGTKKIRRGGSYHCKVHLVRPGYRSADNPSQTYSVVGFRLVAEPSGD